jgi:radical SAM superfamily enzyme YgiQ (UPF0313 family)
MKLCLVSAPTATDFEDPADAQSTAVRQSAGTPPLGLLALAAILDADGRIPAIVNLNSCYYDYLASGRSGVDYFAPWAADVILSTKADVYGFSSISSSYPTSIRIAECVKRSQPECVIVFGGPQASVVDQQTLSTFPFVDYVLRGEADETLPLFLSELAGARDFSSVPGLTWRSPFGPVRNVNASPIQDLDALPLPAFHLTGELANATSAHLEIGRGCPFACTFCSTNDFFRRKFRLKSPQRMLADMRAVAAAWGTRAFELTHDMFTVDRHKVVEFCECMLASGEDFTWACSARTDCVDEELLELMARAGCRGMFFGVEAGSQRMQRIIDKDLDVQRAREMISTAERVGIETTVSLITGFPEEAWDDVRESVNMYMHSLRHPRSSPQLNLLAPLAETPIHTKYRDQLTLEELCSDVGHQGRTQNALDRELIRRYPDIFPNFYLLPVPNLDREFLLELREFLLMGPVRLRWLMVALQQTTFGMFDVFSKWREHRVRLHPGLHGWELRRYYMLAETRTEIVRLILQDSGMPVSSAVECLARLYEALAEAKGVDTRTPEGELTAQWTDTNIPVLAPNIYAVQLDWDVRGVIESLKRGDPVNSVDRSPRYFRTQSADDDARVVETTALIAAGLLACNGTNTVADLVDELAAAFDGPEVARRLAAECLLETLVEEDLIQIHRQVFVRPCNEIASPAANLTATEVSASRTLAGD